MFLYLYFLSFFFFFFFSRKIFLREHLRWSKACSGNYFRFFSISLIFLRQIFIFIAYSFGRYLFSSKSPFCWLKDRNRTSRWTRVIRCLLFPLFMLAELESVSIRVVPQDRCIFLNPINVRTVTSSKLHVLSTIALDFVTLHYRPVCWYKQRWSKIREIFYLNNTNRFKDAIVTCLHAVREHVRRKYFAEPCIPTQATCWRTFSCLLTAFVDMFAGENTA